LGKHGIEGNSYQSAILRATFLFAKSRRLPPLCAKEPVRKASVAEQKHPATPDGIVFIGFTLGRRTRPSRG
jgi:hypothetical protein